MSVSISVVTTFLSLVLWLESYSSLQFLKQYFLRPRMVVKSWGGGTQFTRTLLLMQFSERSRIAKTNMPSIERSFYLLNTPTICAIFLYYWTQCIDSFSLLLQRYIRKANDAKNPAILSVFFVTVWTQLNAGHARLLEKLRPIAFAETCRFLTIQ